MSVKKLRLSIISFIMIAFIIMSTLLSIPMKTYASSADREYPHTISLSLSRSGSTVTYSITVRVREVINSDGPSGGAFFDAGGDYEVTLTYNGTTIDVTSGYYDARSGTCTLVSESGTFNCSDSVTATATIRYLNGGDSFGNNWTGYSVSATKSLGSGSSGSGGSSGGGSSGGSSGGGGSFVVPSTSTAELSFVKDSATTGHLAYIAKSSAGGSWTLYCGGGSVKSGSASQSGTSGSYPVTTAQSGRTCRLDVSTPSSMEDYSWIGGPVIYYGASSDSASTTIPNAYTLKYDANGGIGAPSAQTVWSGSSVAIPYVSPQRTNYKFLGWNTNPSYNNLPYNADPPAGTLTAGRAYTVNSNTTLYAVWSIDKVPYNIAFTLNGKPAKNDFAYITGYVNGGTRVTQSREFSYLEIPGYTVSAKIKSSDENVFLMVGDNKSPGYEYTIPTKTINTGTTDTVNCGTIHTVAYDANGGTYGKDAAGNDIPGPEDMTKYYGTSIVVSSNTPTRIGYNFTQWKSDTTGTSYNPGTGYAYSQRGGTDTLKAQWKPITYKDEVFIFE